jgi:hypothetical protein
MDSKEMWDIMGHSDQHHRKESDHSKGTEGSSVTSGPSRIKKEISDLT